MSITNKTGVQNCFWSPSFAVQSEKTGITNKNWCTKPELVTKMVTKMVTKNPTKWNW